MNHRDFSNVKRKDKTDSVASLLQATRYLCSVNHFFVIEPVLNTARCLRGLKFCEKKKGEKKCELSKRNRS